MNAIKLTRREFAPPRRWVHGPTDHDQAIVIGATLWPNGVPTWQPACACYTLAQLLAKGVPGRASSLPLKRLPVYPFQVNGNLNCFTNPFGT